MPLRGICDSEWHHGLVQAREALCLEVVAVSQVQLTLAPCAPHAQLSSLRFPLALLKGPFRLDDLLGHLFVELVFILIKLVCEVLFRILDLLAELLYVLCGLGIVYDLTDRADYIDEAILVCLFAHVRKDRQTSGLIAYRASRLAVEAGQALPPRVP